MAGYIPDTLKQQEEMLKSIGFNSFDDLYAAVPEAARLEKLELPEGKSEMEVKAYFEALAGKNQVYTSIFRGAGAYDHYIPSIVKEITSRREFLSAYTPYQAEISQGVLQSIFEYQTQICELTGLEVANASVYDGAVAAAEAIFMCLERNRNEVLVSDTIDPETLSVIRTYCESRDVDVVMLKNSKHHIDIEEVRKQLSDKTAALYLESPNFYGLIEDVEELSALMHQHKARIIQGVDPISLAIYKTPGEMDVDIAVGEGQQLGLPLGFGGPYLGFMSCKKELMRRLPGRIVGQTQDHDGNRAFVLTLQAREQHIRREKASSNICSNEALCAMTASVYLAAMGPKGLEKVALSSYSNAHYLKDELEKIGFKGVDDGEFFDEFLTSSPIDPQIVEEKLSARGILSGLIVNDQLLWCATETADRNRIDELISALKEIVS